MYQLPLFTGQHVDHTVPWTKSLWGCNDGSPARTLVSVKEPDVGFLLLALQQGKHERCHLTTEANLYNRPLYSCIHKRCHLTTEANLYNRPLYSCIHERRHLTTEANLHNRPLYSCIHERCHLTTEASLHNRPLHSCIH